ncbi:hypothetical protein LINPERPRIM_LOCUS41564, partial [Linum perenne]
IERESKKKREQRKSLITQKAPGATQRIPSHPGDNQLLLQLTIHLPFHSTTAVLAHHSSVDLVQHHHREHHHRHLDSLIASIP